MRPYLLAFVMWLVAVPVVACVELTSSVSDSFDRFSQTK